VELETYQALTGITVSVDDEDLVIAQINRTRRILEGLLGFTLDPEKVNQNLYIEQGKAIAQCACPNVDTELDPPDPVVFAYRQYSYNPNDKFFHVDPFYEVYEVKLVWNNITIKTFELDEFRPNFANGWGKFIENCQHKICVCSCKNCVQLAVDAEWLFACDSSVDSSVSESCISDDILDIWADMVTYYADCKKDVKSESIGSHSYTKFDNKPPENESYNLAILKKYAGPNGSLTKVITV